MAEATAAVSPLRRRMIDDMSWTPAKTVFDEPGDAVMAG